MCLLRGVSICALKSKSDSPNVAGEVLAARKDHATLAVSATLERLRWRGPVSLGKGHRAGHVGDSAGCNHGRHFVASASFVIRGRVIRGLVVVHEQKTGDRSHIRGVPYTSGKIPDRISSRVWAEFQL